MFNYLPAGKILVHYDLNINTTHLNYHKEHPKYSLKSIKNLT